MSDKCDSDIGVGKYTGMIAEKYRDPELLLRLEDIAGLVRGPGSETISKGRNRNVKLSVTCHGNLLVIAVKCFRSQAFPKDLIDCVRGSKARRTWLAASAIHQRGVGTPATVGFLEYWSGKKLAESYYLAEYQPDITTFTDELIRLFQEDPHCGKFMSLMQCVAAAVSAMHEAGFQHNDLGNQNILLRRKGDAEWGDVQFIDLNRSRVRDRLSLRERARDISRLYLPSDLLRVFKEMYYRDTPPPENFQKWEKFYRRLYALHSRTRNIRHPVRSFRHRKEERSKLTYPSEKDMWIWDERSAQTISTMRPKDRLRFYPVSRHLRIAGATLSGLFPVWREYRSLLGTCYKARVSLKNRVGVAIGPPSPRSAGLRRDKGPKPRTMERQLALLEKLGKIPVFLRFYCHESEKQWDFLAGVVRDLHGQGYPVSIALVQDRKAVTDTNRWTSFVSHVMNQTADHVERVEIGHAINRVKWGVWDFNEHRHLLSGVADLTGRYPAVEFMGPAVIDFEYPFLMAALKGIPESLHFSALSHHLYVDRCGAPENRQGPFSALEKFALARAIARWSPGCEDRLIVSEANWPLKGVGVYSPVGSPYESPGTRFNDPSVSEDDYADYMLRYITIALCSGMVDRVYWWRLVGRGFGLVDDSDPENWRERPAYGMLRYFISLLGESTFVEKVSVDRGQRNIEHRTSDGVHLFMFELLSGERVCLAYSSVGDVEVEVPFEFGKAVDAFGHELGQEVSGKRQAIRLSGRPVYLFLR